MKKNNAPRSPVKGIGAISAITPPAHIRAAIRRGQKAFARHGQFKVIEGFSPKLRTLTTKQKIQDHRDKTFNVLAKVARRQRQQPPMIERFRATAIIVDWLEVKGVPFGVARNSKMNKAVRRLLNDEAELSTDHRKSRRKQIKRDAVRGLLREIRKLRYLSAVFIQLPPYVEYSAIPQFKLPPFAD